MQTPRIPVPRPTISPWYTHRWPWLLMLGPATVLVGGGFAAWLALGHPDAMVVDDYYKQGKLINQDLRRDRAASALHLGVRLRYLPDQGRLQGTIASAGAPLAAPFTVHMAHPTLPERDLVLKVAPAIDGSFSVPLPALEKTHWQLTIEGEKRDWRLARSWDWAIQPELAIVADR